MAPTKVLIYIGSMSFGLTSTVHHSSYEKSVCHLPVSLRVSRGSPSSFRMVRSRFGGCTQTSKVPNVVAQTTIMVGMTSIVFGALQLLAINRSHGHGMSASVVEMEAVGSCALMLLPASQKPKTLMHRSE